MENNTDLPLCNKRRKNIEVPRYTTRNTLAELYREINTAANMMLANQQPVIPSVIYCDRFTPPNDRMFELLGVSQKSADKCEELAPGGKWIAHRQTDADTGNTRFMAWYTKYLPYAYAMMLSEDGFDGYDGIDFTSINGYFKTCMGFHDLGTHYSQKVIEDADSELYVKLYNESTSIAPPNLPFEEVYRPACCYVAFKRPDLFVEYVGEPTDSWIVKHVKEVLTEAKLDVPKFKWKK